MAEQEAKEKKPYPQSVRVVFHAMTDSAIQFYDALERAAREMVKTGVVKDVQLVDESIRVLLPWNKLRKELNLKEE